MAWPAIPYPDWRETCAALHLYTQIVGKYRLAHTPWVNHSWHATLYVTPRGLTTMTVPDPVGPTVVDFDFLDECVSVVNAAGARSVVALEPMSVAAFFDRFKAALGEVGATASVHGAPNELPERVPFAQDTAERPWDGDAVRRFHRALLSVSGVFERFRTGFVGKVSPVHLFWGSFDLAVTRFSGREAPPHPGGIPHLPDTVSHEAYSHEVSSAGFWPGGNGVDEAMFYSYAYPVPSAMRDEPVEPDAARWDDALGEFLLPYAAVAASDDPDAALMAFLQSSYRAAARSADWEPSLAIEPQRPRVPRPVRAPS